VLFRVADFEPEGAHRTLWRVTLISGDSMILESARLSEVVVRILRLIWNLGCIDFIFK